MELDWKLSWKHLSRPETHSKFLTSQLNELPFVDTSTNLFQHTQHHTLNLFAPNIDISSSSFKLMKCFLFELLVSHSIDFIQIFILTRMLCFAFALFIYRPLLLLLRCYFRWICLLVWLVVSLSERVTEWVCVCVSIWMAESVFLVVLPDVYSW